MSVSDTDALNAGALVPLIGLASPDLAGLSTFAGAFLVVFGNLLASRNLERLETKINFEVQTLEQRLGAQNRTFLDKEYLQSDAYQALTFQAVRAAVAADSESKIQIIAQAVLNIALNSPSMHEINKSACLRSIEEMSITEIETLICIFEKYSEKTDVHIPNRKVAEEEIATHLGKSAVFISNICDGLKQAGMILDPTIGGWGGSVPGMWKPTNLAMQVVTLCRNPKLE